MLQQIKERDVQYSNIAFLILQKIANLQDFLQNMQRDVRHSTKNFAKSSFFNIAKVRNAGLPVVRSQTD